MRPVTISAQRWALVLRRCGGAIPAADAKRIRVAIATKKGPELVRVLVQPETFAII